MGAKFRCVGTVLGRLSGLCLFRHLELPERLLDLQRQTCRSLDVGNSDAPGTVRRLLNDRSPSFHHRLAILIAVLTVEPEGRQRVLVRGVEDELDGTKWKDCERLALVRWLELPDAFEPAEGGLQISYTDMEVAAFHSLPPVRP